MANYAYKRTVQTNMKCVGLLDTNKMTITIDDVEKGFIYSPIRF